MIIYFWYDHCVLRETGEAELVTQAIKNHDFETFTAIRKKYPTRDDVCFFPRYAYDYSSNDKRVKRVDITRKSGFDRVTRSEYECG